MKSYDSGGNGVFKEKERQAPYISNLDNYRVVVMEKCQNEVANDVTGEVDNMAPITQTLCLLRIDGG